MPDKKQVNQERDQQETRLEDLPVNEATTEQVKGGPGAGDSRGYE